MHRVPLGGRAPREGQLPGPVALPGAAEPGPEPGMTQAGGRRRPGRGRGRGWRCAPGPAPTERRTLARSWWQRGHWARGVVSPAPQEGSVTPSLRKPSCRLLLPSFGSGVAFEPTAMALDADIERARGSPDCGVVPRGVCGEKAAFHRKGLLFPIKGKPRHTKPFV